MGKHFVIKPSWEEYEKKESDIVVTIDPGTAFGTGLHETTRGVIILLEEIIEAKGQDGYNVKDLHMLDAGTGSGILAIAASKMGIRNILAIDNDIEAVDTAKENIIANDIQHGINAEHTTLEKITDSNYYDIVLANIIPDVLINSKNILADILKNGSDLVLSGILEKEEGRILDEFSKIDGLKLFKKVQLGEWTTIWFKLSNSKIN